MVRLRETDQLSDNEINDIIQCSNIVIRHMTDGNEIEEEVTSVMGGHVFELSSEKIIRETKEKMQPRIDELEAMVADKDAMIADKDAKLADKDAEITRLKEKIEELSAV